MTLLEKRQMWQDRIAEFKSSGESVKKWCAANDVKCHQMYYWLNKLNNKKQRKKSTPWLAIEVNPLHQEQSSSVSIKIGKAIIEVNQEFDPELLSKVVKVLSSNV